MRAEKRRGPGPGRGRRSGPGVGHEARETPSTRRRAQRVAAARTPPPEMRPRARMPPLPRCTMHRGEAGRGSVPRQAARGRWPGAAWSGERVPRPRAGRMPATTQAEQGFAAPFSEAGRRPSRAAEAEQPEPHAWPLASRLRAATVRTPEARRRSLAIPRVPFWQNAR